MLKSLFDYQRGRRTRIVLPALLAAAFAFKLWCLSCMNFGLFIILKQTTNYANSTLKQHIQQISNGLSTISFLHLLFSLCIFDKSSKSTGYASFCVICQQEMNSNSDLFLWGGFCILLPLRTATTGEQKWIKKKRFCLFGEIAFDINIWYLKHDCFKVPFKFCQDLPLSLDG